MTYATFDLTIIEHDGTQHFRGDYHTRLSALHPIVKDMGREGFFATPDLFIAPAAIARILIEEKS